MNYVCIVINSSGIALYLVFYLLRFLFFFPAALLETIKRVTEIKIHIDNLKLQVSFPVKAAASSSNVSWGTLQIYDN
jgi:hypothetical protein